MTIFEPTAEQKAAMDVFRTGESFAIQAGAGAGKTATLLLLAESDTKRGGQYVAFNKAIVVDAGEKMPGHVACNTAHSLAFRAIGHRYKHRLQSRRMRSSELASRLGVEPIFLTVARERRTLQPGYLASLVMRSVERFCQTPDAEIGRRHVPYIDGIDLVDDQGRRTYENNRKVAEALEPALRRAWADIVREDGQLPFRHSHYLKLWQLSEDPRVPADVIYFDEVQDADPVMADVVMRQEHAQVVLVGDSQQEVYSWRGAVNAFDLFGLPETYLTQSFRFGPAVAEVANLILERLGAKLRLRGFEEITSRVGPVDTADCVLCRTNATAVRTVLTLQAAGTPVHLVGGGDEVVRFARAARDLQGGRPTEHPELACFATWSQVIEYVQQDPSGSDLELLVRLCEEFGPDTIERALNGTTREGPGVVTISTAHKAKGREWHRVRLAPDFAARDGTLRDSPEELRLLYVAVTRAQHELDLTALPELDDEQSQKGEGVDASRAITGIPDSGGGPTAGGSRKTARAAAEPEPAHRKGSGGGPETIPPDPSSNGHGRPRYWRMFKRSDRIRVGGERGVWSFVGSGTDRGGDYVEVRRPDGSSPRIFDPRKREIVDHDSEFSWEVRT